MTEKIISRAKEPGAGGIAKGDLKLTATVGDLHGNQKRCTDKEIELRRKRDYAK